MTIEQLLPLLLVGGIGGLITALTQAWVARHTIRREEKQQQIDETSSLAAGAKTITDAATSAVKLQDEQIAEFRQEIRALQVEIMALNTRMNREIELRMRVQAELTATTDRLEREMQNHAAMKVRVAELQQTVTNLQAIGERGDEMLQLNEILKVKVFEISKGVMQLTRQLHEAGLAPEYRLEIPAIDTET